MGLIFASWASRIPDIKTTLHLSEGDLGTILFALPIGQLIVMPFSGKLVTRYGSYYVLIFSLLLYAISLTNLGLATQAWHLALGLLAFGVTSNLCNIAINTQGVYTEELFKKTIMGSFHGSWSFAGFSGALLGISMVALGLSPYIHFLIVVVMVVLLMAFNYKFLIVTKDKIISEKKAFFSKPDSTLV